MVFLTMKTWLQDEVITNLDSTVIKRGWQGNLVSLPGRRSGLTCTARWSPASEEGSEHHEPSRRGDAASSLCLKVGGWTCAPVFETAGSQNPLQGTSAKLRTVGRLVVSLVESLLVNNPEKQAEVRSLFPTWIMADPLQDKAHKWQAASSSSWVRTKLFFFFLLSMLLQSMLKANHYHHNPFLLISSWKTAFIKTGRKRKDDKKRYSFP